MQQAGIGAGYIYNIITQHLSTYLRSTDIDTSGPVNLVERKLFNPNGISVNYFRTTDLMENDYRGLIVPLGARDTGA
jgi:ABC-2 type transport system permease protein